MKNRMTDLGLITHHEYAGHRVPAGHPERPARIITILQMLDESFASLSRMEAETGTLQQIELIHTAGYAERIFAAEPVTGSFSLDADTHLGPGSVQAALLAVGGACQAVDAVLKGRCQRVFVASRPPGHHAEPETPMGFCLFSNAAIAAEYARQSHGLERVAVLDFDVHHGNGTQAAFWARPGLFYASSHEMPLFPGTGAVSETGQYGNIFNTPLTAGTDGAGLIAAWQQRLLPAIEAAAPELIILSAGFDAHHADPLAGLMLEAADFGRLTLLIRDLAERVCAGRIVSILEGGYDLAGLKASCQSHLAALE